MLLGYGGTVGGAKEVDQATKKEGRRASEKAGDDIRDVAKGDEEQGLRAASWRPWVDAFNDSGIVLCWKT